MTPLDGLNISMIESFVFYDLDHIIIYMEISEASVKSITRYWGLQITTWWKVSVEKK